jgi:DNA polymerase (family 10)
MDRAAISRTLSEIAVLFSLKGENPFKVRAFENAAETISEVEDLDELARQGKLASVPGIGKAIAEVVSELVLAGRSSLRDELGVEFPASIFELLRVPGLGPKKAMALFKELGISSPGELEYAIHENRLLRLAGFGAKTQEKLAGGLRFLGANAGRWRLPQAWEVAERALAYVRLSPEEAGLERVEVAGELRRGLETVSEIVLAAACTRPETLRVPETQRGEPSVRIVSGPRGSFGNTWLVATGSATHLAALAKRDEGGAALTAPAESEEAIYGRLGLSLVPPELREEGGAIERAARGEAFPLVETADLRGLFHLHTTYSDGRATLEETFRRAVDLGYQYAGITDHSPAAAYAGGLSPERVRIQWREIESLRPRFPSLTIFRGTEADILPDGSIDYGDDLLHGFDFVIASVHSAFHLPRAEQTARLVKAVTNPRVTMLGHATGRLLLARRGIDVDVEAVLAAAGRAGTGVEINASPSRLDLDWRFGELARAAGVFTSVNPDAHALSELTDVRFGIAIARKAGYSRDLVLNAGSAEAVSATLQRLRARS